jgi:hypothetical protein
MTTSMSPTLKAAPQDLGHTQTPFAAASKVTVVDSKPPKPM